MHRSVAALDGFYETPEHFYLVMEFIGGGELFEALVEEGAYSEARAASILKEVASGLALLHAQGLCHADIKPENLLLTSRDADAHVKLVDFGLSTSPREASKRKPGTWAYWPPEAFVRSEIGLATDMWALGVLGFILLSGYHPFDPYGDASDATLRHSICATCISFDDPVWENVSSHGKRFLRRLLQPEPTKRLTVEQMLQDPWLRSGGASDAKVLQSDDRLRAFRQHTARLRAAVFATIVQQRQKLRSSGQGDSRVRVARAPLSRPDSSDCENTLEADILSSAFRVFDVEGKGFISQGDLSRVMSSLGAGADDSEVAEWMEKATQTDREGTRVMYGEFIDLMTHTARRKHEASGVIFNEGDMPDGFHLILYGSVEVLQNGRKVAELAAGEHFGETALLSDAPRNATVRCVEGAGCETLLLSREDFDAAHFMTGGGSGGGKEAAMRQSLGFIQMVSQMKREAVCRGDTIFREGDPASRFYIIEQGAMKVDSSAGGQLAVLGTNDCFGERAILTGEPRNATVTCASEECRVVSVTREDFLRLMQRSTVLHDGMKHIASRRRSDQPTEVCV